MKIQVLERQLTNTTIFKIVSMLPGKLSHPTSRTSIFSFHISTLIFPTQIGNPVHT